MTILPDCLLVGDAHAAKIMVPSVESLENGCKILYGAFEVGGFHPIILDLPKPLYISVFFRTLSLHGHVS